MIDDNHVMKEEVTMEITHEITVDVPVHFSGDHELVWENATVDLRDWLNTRYNHRKLKVEQTNAEIVRKR